MSEQSEARPPRPWLKWALGGAALIGVAAVLYIVAQASFTPSGAGGVKSLARGEMAKLVVPAAATPAPATSFYDAAGKPLRVADLKGKVVVLNLWATWCAPCVAEMPTLARLSQEYAGQPVEVVAVSLDRASEVDKARLFIARHAPLKFYSDPKSSLPFAFDPPAAGVPTTVIYGKDGIERGRLSGGADWSGQDAKAVIDAVLAQS